MNATSTTNTTAYTAPPDINRVQTIALGIGVIGAIASVIGLMANPHQFFRSYLLAFLFWLGIPLGCLGLLMVQHVAGGAWGVVIRRILEASIRTLPLMAILFLPIAFGVNYLFEWAHHDAVEANAILKSKAAYLNVPFFWARAAIYFVAWLGLGYFLTKWSDAQDERGDRRLADKLQTLSGPGIVIFAITITFASVDWLMSLEPEWFSTIFGLLLMVGWALSALAFAIAVLVLLSGTEPLSGVIAPRHFHDLGKLMLALVMLWAYFSFSQYLIIWSANLPEEITYYLRRQHGGWKWVAIGLLVFHFALPFLLLLSRNLKRNARRLRIVALLVLLMRFIDLYWLVAPTPDINPQAHGNGGGGGGHHGPHLADFHFQWMDIAVPVAMGGLWLAFFAWNFKRRPLLPVNDPLLEKALTHSGHGH